MPYFSPQPLKEAAQAQIPADRSREANHHQLPYWPRPREAIVTTTTRETTAGNCTARGGRQITRIFSQSKKDSSLPEPKKKKRGFEFQAPTVTIC